MLIEDLLREVKPGRTLRIAKTRLQRETLRDRDAKIGLKVVEHLLGARCTIDPKTPDRPYPLTEACFQTVAAKLGHRVGIKRARVILHRLRTAGVMNQSGSYRQPYRLTGSGGGYRVKVWRTAIVLFRDRGGSSCSPAVKHPVGPRTVVKPRKRRPREPWWAHGLFGNPDGLPPPDKRERKMRSDDERRGAGLASA